MNNELLHGDPRDIVDYMLNVSPPLAPDDVRLVVINAMKRIADLEGEVVQLRKEIEALAGKGAR